MKLNKYILALGLLFVAFNGALFAQNEEYQLYEVQRSEGWYRVSKKFNVSQEVLKAANPQCGEALRLGDTLRILLAQKPKVEKKDEVMDTTHFVLHTLKPKETLYGLSRRYGVKIEDIVKWNGENASRMAIGSQLRIPQAMGKRKATTVDTLKVVPAAPIAVLVDSLSSLPSVVDDSLYALTPSEIPMRIAFLLPFMLDAAGQDAVRDRFVEFYEGALLAIRDAKIKGVNVEVYTFDVEKNNLKVQLLLQQPQMKLMDAIIGPAYPSQVEYISNFAFDNKINTFIPFTSEVPALQINPYLFQFNPPTDYEAECLTSVLLRERPVANYILIKNGNQTSSLGVQLAEELEAHQIKVQKVNIPVDEVDTLRHFLRDDLTNILLFADSRYAYVKPYLKKVDEWNSVSTELVGGCTWQAHEAEIGVPYYYTSLFNASPGILRKNAYLNAYKHYFAHSPSGYYPRYDMLGYDITSMVIRSLNRYGVGTLQQKIDADKFKGVQSNVCFQRSNPMGGFVNLLLNVLRYDNGATHTMQRFEGNVAPISTDPQ